MKVAFFGNVCNFAYWFAKWGRTLGYDTYAILERNEKFGRDRPEWEDPEYDPKSPPHWVRFYDPGRPIDRALRGYADQGLKQTLREFEALQTFSITTAMASHMMERLFVHHTIGSFGRSATWMKFHTLRSMISPRRIPTTIRFRRSLHASSQIIVSTAIEHFEVGNGQFRNKLVPIPIAYDASRAGAFSIGNRNDWGTQALTFVMPARQHWSLKGQDIVLRAFATLGKHKLGKSRIVLMDWGVDRDRTKQLVAQLDLDDIVDYSPILPKEALWTRCAQPNTIVIDQFPHLDFHGGGIGGVARDAMAVGAPVITHAAPVSQMTIHKTPPPVFHADTKVESVADQIRQCLEMDSLELFDRGMLGKKWIWDECHYENVIPRYMQIHEKNGIAGTR